MASLSEIKTGAEIKGLSPSGIAKVVSVQWYGDQAAQIVYEYGNGKIDSRIVYRNEEPTLEIVSEGKFWSFEADGSLFRLASEAHRIGLAHLFDPYLAIHTSQIDPLPHQITAVYGEMLSRQPLRFVLADDPGAGKTIMAGLLIKELMIRGDLERCMIVAPGSLVEQWQDELYQKFGLDFMILSRDTFENSRSGNPFNEHNLIIARLDVLSRNEEIQEKIKLAKEFDLIVCDEAHKMSATFFGGETKYTKRYRLGQLLGQKCRHFLPMTATPHNGKEEDFQLFMALLDGDRFEGKPRDGVHKADVSDMMRRLTKEELLTFEGKPLFPERRAYTVKYELTDEEAALYHDVTKYVTDEMNRADRFVERDEKRRVNVGFALQILQRRLASSPEAIYQSLKRRRERLEKNLEEQKLLQRGEKISSLAEDYGDFLSADELDDLEDAPEGEIEQTEDLIVDRATAAATIEELTIEIQTLKKLEIQALKLRQSGRDAKWRELSSILEHPLMVDEDGNRRKLIIFSESRDTLFYLNDRISSLLGNKDAVVMIHGGVGREERRKVVHAFTQNKDVLILLANDAAGEGVNLQRAHLMVNYDLPWNPNRLEQRFGRIHRIGQKEVCHLWNLIAHQTREGHVYSALLEKIEIEKQALGGRVYDVLGRIFEAQPLKDLLVEAIRYGERPEIKARLNQIIDNTLAHDNIISLLEEKALVHDTLSVGQITKIKEDMERAQARRLQPHFIQSFFMEAFQHLGGRVHKREPGRFEITHVPGPVRDRDRLIGMGEAILDKYERICFEKDKISASPVAAFVCPGHPLLDGTRDLILERYRDLLKIGAILIDENDLGEDIRGLIYLEHAVQDGRVTRGGSQQVISQMLQFVEFQADGTPLDSGSAPYLDYRPVKDEERDVIRQVVQDRWQQEGLENKAVAYAIQYLVPRHVEEVKARKLPLIDKIEQEVTTRLRREIAYWDRRAEDLKAQEAAGKSTKLSSDNAAARANELADRLQRRLASLEDERKVTAQPPKIFGGALIVPVGLLNKHMGGKPATTVNQMARDKVEELAMLAVIQSEKILGREPRDVSASRGLGYDIESRDPTTGSLFFIEVKGRWHEHDDVTVTKNEILCARNEPEKFRLALVQVMETGALSPRYLAGYDYGEPDFEETTRTYSMKKLLQRAGEPV